VRPIGRLEQLDPSVQRRLQKAVEGTKACTGTIVQIALNYSGRQELLDLVRGVARDAAAGRLSADSIDEATVNERLTTRGLPDPDLLIRTSGEQRISNFLLWQLAYSEIYFCPVLWPDFGTRELLRALIEYQSRERRFGGLSPRDSMFGPTGAPVAKA
jgi:undecaprenyl diphosphate synthase